MTAVLLKHHRSWIILLLDFCADTTLLFTAACYVVSFGRIGRIVCRIGIRNGLDFLAINDPFIEPEYMVGSCTFL